MAIAVCREPVATGALLMGQVHIQAIGLRLARQIRPPIAFVPINQARPVIQIQPRCCVGVDHRVQLASGNAVLLGGWRSELEQSFCTTGAAAGQLVEGAAGLYVGKTQEVVTRNIPLGRFAFDDIEHLGS